MYSNAYPTMPIDKIIYLAQSYQRWKEKETERKKESNRFGLSFIPGIYYPPG
jgi:hypothetical protein